MVIGNGMIGKAFEDYREQDDIVIFASGVSDSLNTGSAAFKREKKLVADTLKTSQDKLLVYFGTCSIYDKTLQDSAYIKHKLSIENYIVANHSPYLIFRLTNPVGYTENTKTVVNYFIKNIIEQHQFEVWQKAARNIIDVNDMYQICNEIIQQNLFTNSIVNIANPKNYTVPFIVGAIENHFSIKGNYKIIDKGDGPVIDSSLIQPLFQKFNINFDEHYLSKILQKYFPQ